VHQPELKCDEIKFSICLVTEVRRTNNICAIRSTNILNLHGPEPILLAFLKPNHLTRKSTSHRSINKARRLRFDMVSLNEVQNNLLVRLFSIARTHTAVPLAAV
jgi:hypothetical protein